MANTGTRRAIEKWFHANDIRPRLVGEFEDPALLHVFAFHGLGFIPVATLVAKEAVTRFGFGVIGQTEECRQRFYAITPERRLTHPIVAAITSGARKRLSGTK
jgi:LysR family transcriptional activator of nhaA